LSTLKRGKRPGGKKSHKEGGGWWRADRAVKNRAPEEKKKKGLYTRLHREKRKGKTFLTLPGEKSRRLNETMPKKKKSQVSDKKKGGFFLNRGKKRALGKGPERGNPEKRRPNAGGGEGEKGGLLSRKRKKKALCGRKKKGRTKGRGELSWGGKKKKRKEEKEGEKPLLEGPGKKNGRIDRTLRSSQRRKQ